MSQDSSLPITSTSSLPSVNVAPWCAPATMLNSCKGCSEAIEVSSR
jgi:hypothetical protein